MPADPQPQPFDERQMLDACGHIGPYVILGHICARGPGGYHVVMMRCDDPNGGQGCGRTYLVEES